MSRFLFRLVQSLALMLILVLGYFFFFQARMIYFPTVYRSSEIAAFEASGGQRVDYKTSQGTQAAWLQVPRDGGVPERFWIVCAGNGSRALQLSGLQTCFGLGKDALLLLDYPGYGACQGRPSPATIRESLQIAVPLATKAAHFPLEELGAHGIIFGHSLGCATSLLGAEIYGIRRGVLLAPFTSMMEMTQVVLHVPLGWLVRHRFDNRDELKKLAARGGHVWIFHGEMDAYIPLKMGRTLARELGKTATFHKVPHGGHNDLLDLAAGEIAVAMQQARE